MKSIFQFLYGAFFLFIGVWIYVFMEFLWGWMKESFATVRRFFQWLGSEKCGFCGGRVDRYGFGKHGGIEVLDVNGWGNFPRKASFCALCYFLFHEKVDNPET